MWQAANKRLANAARDIILTYGRVNGAAIEHSIPK